MDSVRFGYEKYGIDEYYRIHQLDYKNPHEKTISELLNYAKDNWNLGNNLLDLCCGSGEVTRVFFDKNIEGIDPYTFLEYSTITGKKCRKLTFKDIVENGLNQKYNTIICSFAMHLCEESMLPMLLYRLGEVSNNLLIITPHKRPDCEGIFGWNKVDSLRINKVNMILYKKK